MRKISKKVGKGYLVYAGDLSFKSDAYEVLHLSDVKKIFSDAHKTPPVS